MADYQDILKRAIQIRDAVLEGTNTASLVGGVMVDTLYLSRKLETTINQVIKSIKELGGSGGTGGGSIDENTLAAYLINNGYAKLTDIPSSWWGQTANANNVVQGSMSQVLSLLFTNETIALDGIANEDTPTDSKTKIVTPNYVNDKFIPRKEDANVLGSLTFDKIQKFLKGLKVGPNGDWTLDELDNTHLTTDYLQVRMKAIFETLEILHTDTSGGELFITPVGSNRILKVEEVNITYDGVSQKAYRCYFLGEQDGSKVENKWKVGDQARSKSFNLTQGKYHNVGNHYYWRLVIGVSTETVEIDGKKYHYVDLSDIDKDAASDEPMVDDILNQCGNRTDNARQSCLVFSAVDTYSPSVTLYHGVNGYTFNNKEYVDYGVNHSTGKAFFHVYGDMYFGDRPTSANNYEGDSYVKYDSDKKKVTIKGDLDIKSTYDGKTLDKYITEKSLDKNAVETIIKKSDTITDLKNQIDGAIETWFYDGVPTLKNEPAIGWTDNEKKIHLGDLYYDNLTGKAYRFAKDGNTYKWTIIKDTELTKALEDSRQALKDKFLDSLDLWLEERVDDMLKDNAAMAIPAVYIKRGCNNIINKYEGKISDGIDKAALFLADENGNIDANTLFKDAMELFKGMEEMPFDLGLIDGVIGKGKVAINLPDNILMSILFGNKKTITFNENDFLELKSLLLDQE